MTGITQSETKVIQYLREQGYHAMRNGALIDVTKSPVRLLFGNCTSVAVATPRALYFWDHAFEFNDQPDTVSGIAVITHPSTREESKSIADTLRVAPGFGSNIITIDEDEYFAGGSYQGVIERFIPGLVDRARKSLNDYRSRMASDTDDNGNFPFDSIGYAVKTVEATAPFMGNP